MSRVDAIALLGGDIAVDFANTVAYHAGDSERREYLTDYADVVRWASKVHAISADDARRLTEEAERHAVLAKRAHERALQLREAMYRVLTASSKDGTPHAADIVALHKAAVQAQAAALPEWRDHQMTLAWPVAGEPDLTGRSIL